MRTSGYAKAGIAGIALWALGCAQNPAYYPETTAPAAAPVGVAVEAKNPKGDSSRQREMLKEIMSKLQAARASATSPEQVAQYDQAIAEVQARLAALPTDDQGTQSHAEPTAPSSSSHELGAPGANPL